MKELILFIRLRGGVLNLLFILLLCSGCGSRDSLNKPTVEKGYLDLSRWNFQKSGTIELSGEWRIFWDQLLSPLEIEAVSGLEEPVWANLPGDWGGVESQKPLPQKGFATYTAVIEFPPRNQMLGIRLRDINTAYRLFANDRLIAEVGKVAANSLEYQPDIAIKTVFFSTDSSLIRLTLQVSNFSLPRGGPITVLELGDSESISNKSRHRGYLDLFVFGLLVIAALHHLILFYQRREDKTTLLFALFCMIIAVRTVLTGEKTGANLLFDWSVTYKIDVLTIYLAIPVFYMFFRSVFPRYFSRGWVRLTQVLAVVNTVIVVLTPAPVYTRLLIPNYVALMIFVFYVGIVLVREIRDGSEGAVLIGVGMLAVLVTITNDVLLATGLIYTFQITHFGIFAFVAAQSYLISIRFSAAFASVRAYSLKLADEMETRAEAESRLIESEKRFRELADFLPIPVAEFNFDLRITYVNLCSLELFGYTAEEFENRINVLTLIEEAFHEKIMKRVSGLKEGKVPEPLELFLRRKDGSLIWGEVHPSLIKQGDELAGVRSCFVDLTARREVERKLRQSHDELEMKVEQRTAEIKTAMEMAEKANQLKSEFLANISHELRNPMHQILSYSKYGIQKIDKPKPKLLHYFNQTHKAAERLMVLLNDLLDLSKLESGRMEYTFEPYRIDGIVSEVISDFDELLAEKNLKLDVQEGQGSVEVNCDGFKIGQVIRNLLANAVEYSPAGTSILISVDWSSCNMPDCDRKSDDHSCVRVSVKDQGVGIPENELETIFDKFTQSSLTKTGAGGTGLGLAICCEIIEAHKGRLWVTNNPTGGATFNFCLPL